VQPAWHLGGKSKALVGLGGPALGISEKSFEAVDEKSTSRRKLCRPSHLPPGCDPLSVHFWAQTGAVLLRRPRDSEAKLLWDRRAATLVKFPVMPRKCAEAKRHFSQNFPRMEFTPRCCRTRKFTHVSLQWGWLPAFFCPSGWSELCNCSERKSLKRADHHQPSLLQQDPHSQSIPHRM